MSGKKMLSSKELEELFAKNDSGSSTDDKKSYTEIGSKQEGSHYISKFQSCMMLARFCVGSGLFSIPAAFRYSGIAMGLFWIVINGFLTAYGMRKLVDASWEVSRRTGASSVYYGDLGAECARVFNEESAKIGRILVNVVIVVTAFALVCAQIIYLADIWKQGFEQLGVPEMYTSTWIVVAYCVLFPLFQIRQPDMLATFSLVANLLTVVGAISIFVHIFSVRPFRIHAMIWRSTNKVHWTKLPLTIGITSYAYQLVAPLIVTMQNVMKEPRRTPFVINIVMAGVTVLYMLMGATGYSSCYPDCKDSIVLNLPGTRYYSVVKILLGLASCVGTTLGVFICLNIVEHVLRDIFPENRFLVASILCRIFVLTFAAGITSAIPQLGNVMSLAGTLTNPTVGFIFPAVAHMALFYKTLSRASLAKDIALLFCGLLILALGLYSSIYNIIHDL